MLIKYFSVCIGFVLLAFSPCLSSAENTQIEIEFSHRLIPHGTSPDSFLLDNEGSIPVLFTSNAPIESLDNFPTMEQIDENVYSAVIPWDWEGSQLFRFRDEDGDTLIIDATPQLVFPFNPEDHQHPVINIQTDRQNLWDPETGIYVWGNYENFLQRGDDWERYSLFDYYDENNELIIHEEIGLRINGGYGRYYCQKGLRVYYDDYGTSDDVEYDFFGSEPTSFRRLILRDNYYPSDFIRSNLIEKVFADLGHRVSRYALVQTYLNDEYWGSSSLRERFDEEYFERTMDLDGTNYIYLKDGETGHGDGAQWSNFLESFSEVADPTSHSFYETLNETMDLDSYIDWLFLNIYCASTDNGFVNNVVILKREGGKWEHIMWDEDDTMHDSNISTNHFRLYSAENEAEFELYLPSINHWVWREDRQLRCTMFNTMMHNSEFKNRFSLRLDELLDNELSTSQWQQQLDELTSNQLPAVDAHAERWGWYSPTYYPYFAGIVGDWLTDRHPIVVQQKSDFMEHFRAPVELSAFTVEPLDDQVLLAWETSSEDNCSGFIVYHGVGSPDNLVQVASFESSEELEGSGGIWQQFNYEWELSDLSQSQENFFQLAYVDSQTGEEFRLNWVVEYWENISVDLVLNELLADNCTIVADDSGDFDDWFEIANMGEQAQSLHGIFLSDDSSYLTKFQYLGDLVLAPGEKAIFWADNEPEEGDNHCNFKLSSSGEALILTAPDGTTEIDV